VQHYVRIIKTEIIREDSCVSTYIPYNLHLSFIIHTHTHARVYIYIYIYIYIYMCVCVYINVSCLF